MRIAVPIWEDRVSPVLDSASRLLVVEVEEEKESSRFETLLDVQDMSRRCCRIQGLGVDTLICGALSRPLLRRLMASGIRIIAGISGNLEDVLAAYFGGDLDSREFLMPGFKRQRSSRRPKESSKGRGKRQRRKAKRKEPISGIWDSVQSE